MQVAFLSPPVSAQPSHRHALRLPARRLRPVERARHALVPSIPARPQGKSRRRPDRQPQADAARRAGPPDRRRHLCLAAARLPRPQEDRADRARGAGPRRRPGNADADAAVGRAVARERPLRRLRARDAAHPRPARARDALRPDQRGNDHRALPRRGEELPRPAAHALSYPVEVPRRGPAALRRDARTRVPDEGRLQLRPRRSRRAAELLHADARLSAHLPAAWASRRCR